MTHALARRRYGTDRLLCTPVVVFGMYWYEENAGQTDGGKRENAGEARSNRKVFLSGGEETIPPASPLLIRWQFFPLLKKQTRNLNDIGKDRGDVSFVKDISFVKNVHACNMHRPHRASTGLGIHPWYRKPIPPVMNLDIVFVSGVKKWCQTGCGSAGMDALFSCFTAEHQDIAFQPSGVKKWCQKSPVSESACSLVIVSAQIISIIRRASSCAVFLLRQGIRLYLHLLYRSFPAENPLKWIWEIKSLLCRLKCARMQGTEAVLYLIIYREPAIPII